MPTQTQTNQLQAKQVSYGYAPKEGPRSFPLTLDFTKGNPIPINLIEQSQQNILEWVQAIYADNSNNTAELSITDSITGQVLTWPASTQGYLPFMCGGNPVFSASTSTAEISVPIQLLTFPVPAFLWSCSGYTGSLGVDFSANKPALAANLLSTAPINAKRKSISVQNQSANTIQVVMDNGGTSQQSIGLLAPNTGGAGLAGDNWSSKTFKGRLRIFSGAAGDQVFVHED